MRKSKVCIAEPLVRFHSHLTLFYDRKYEDRPLRIAVTEPRRIAAMSVAQRVATELNVGLDTVSYQVCSIGSILGKAGQKLYRFWLIIFSSHSLPGSIRQHNVEKDCHCFYDGRCSAKGRQGVAGKFDDMHGLP